MGTLREALARTLRLTTPPVMLGAGRTDAGVHAFAQVVHVDLFDPLYPDIRGEESERLIRSLNSQLAGRIVIHRARPVPAEFDARHSAQWRAYRYLVLERDSPALELTSRVAWTVEGPLDLAAMNRAAQAMIGVHDFRSFCRRPAGDSVDEPLTREVLSALWSDVDDPWGVAVTPGRVLRFDVRGKSFCHQMVRSMVGLMVAIGQSTQEESSVVDRLLNPRRRSLPANAPPSGLCLMGVGYDQFAGGPSGFVS